MPGLYERSHGAVRLKITDGTLDETPRAIFLVAIALVDYDGTVSVYFDLCPQAPTSK